MFVDRSSTCCCSLINNLQILWPESLPVTIKANRHLEHLNGCGFKCGDPVICMFLFTTFGKRPDGSLFNCTRYNNNYTFNLSLYLQQLLVLSLLKKKQKNPKNNTVWNLSAQLTRGYDFVTLGSEPYSGGLNKICWVCFISTFAF